MTKQRIAAAFAIALTADALQFLLTGFTATGVLAVPAEAADFVLDIAVAVMTTKLIGFHWALLPTFAIELVPGVDMLPTWTACVALAVAANRKRRPGQQVSPPVIDV